MIYEILRDLGLLALIGGVLWGILKIVFAHIKGIKLGVQALLRAQMIHDYNKWSERGYAPLYARQNFENCWVHYHSLGANGVMNDIRQRFFELPIEPKEGA